MSRSKAQQLVDELNARRVLQRLGVKVPSQLSNDSIFARHCTGTATASYGVVRFADGSTAEIDALGVWRASR